MMRPTVNEDDIFGKMVAALLKKEQTIKNFPGFLPLMLPFWNFVCSSGTSNMTEVFFSVSHCRTRPSSSPI
jgi:hypothetical protein